MGFASRPLLAEELEGKLAVSDEPGVSPKGVVNSPPPWGLEGRKGGRPPSCPQSRAANRTAGAASPVASWGGKEEKHEQRLDAVTPEAPHGSQPAEQGLTADPERALSHCP